MVKPFFKKIWSYIQDVHLESVESEYNKELHVVLSKGRYQLCTPNAIYSYEDKYTNFLESFRAIRLDDLKIQNVLILGFGLGSIPHILEKKFYKKYSYTGVEIDDAIIYLASKYGIDDLSSDIEMIQADAWNYVMLCDTQYDMICVDIFLDVHIPIPFLSRDFLMSLKEILSDQGIILFNHLALHSHEISAAQTYFEDVFSDVFKNGVALNVKGNIMMVSDKSIMKRDVN
jgi:spermidine synthase